MAKISSLNRKGMFKKRNLGTSERKNNTYSKGIDKYDFPSLEFSELCLMVENKNYNNV